MTKTKEQITKEMAMAAISKDEQNRINLFKQEYALLVGKQRKT